MVRFKIWYSICGMKGNEWIPGSLSRVVLTFPFIQSSGTGSELWLCLFETRSSYFFFKGRKKYGLAVRPCGFLRNVQIALFCAKQNEILVRQNNVGSDIRRNPEDRELVQHWSFCLLCWLWLGERIRNTLLVERVYFREKDVGEFWAGGRYFNRFISPCILSD